MRTAMAIEAKITSKGQITVPLEVRKELGVKPGDKIRFERNSDREITVLPVRKESLFEKYRGIERTGVGATKREILTEIRRMRDGED